MSNTLQQETVQIIDRMKELTPDAVRISGQVLQAQAEYTMNAVFFGWVFLILFAIILTSWCVYKKKRDRYMDDFMIEGLLCVPLVLAFLGLFLGTILMSSVFVSSRSPEAALTVRILNALPGS